MSVKATNGCALGRVRWWHTKKGRIADEAIGAHARVKHGIANRVLPARLLRRTASLGNAISVMTDFVGLATRLAGGASCRYTDSAWIWISKSAFIASASRTLWRHDAFGVSAASNFFAL